MTTTFDGHKRSLERAVNSVTSGSKSAASPQQARGAVSNSILETIGRTPLVHLTRVFEDSPFSLFAKLEGANPGGSAKDRAAFHMIMEARRLGHVTADTVIVESSSGNMAIGLAHVCGYLRLRFICVVDPKTTQTHLRILRALGAEIDRVEVPDPATGEYLAARLARVRHLVATHPNAFWPNQYANDNNPAAHYATTMPEIVAALDGRVDYLFCATSTCGTLSGCARFVREHRMQTSLIAVDAVGSVLFGDCSAPRLLPGHGASIRPPLREQLVFDRCVHISDWECVVACRQLARREAILAGASSGAVLSAVAKLSPEIPPDAVCVAILHDDGERYLDTVYSDDWVARTFGQEARL